MDGAARIVDPTFEGINTDRHVWGQFLKISPHRLATPIGLPAAILDWRLVETITQKRGVSIALGAIDPERGRVTTRLRAGATSQRSAGVRT